MRKLSYAVMMAMVLLVSTSQTVISLPLAQEAAQKLSTADSEKLAEAKRLGLEGKRLFQEGQIKESLQPIKQSLAIKEKVLGKDHLSVATSLYSLGTICLTISNLEIAKQYFNRALKICEKAIVANQPNDPKEVNILSVLEGLSECNERKSEWGKAETYQLRALSRRIETLGENHTDVGVNLLNLIAIQIEKKSFDKAEQNVQRALTVFEKSLGKNHLKYAEALESYAWLFYRMGKEAEADKKIEQVNEIVFNNAADKTAPLEFYWRSFRCRLTKKKDTPYSSSPGGTKVGAFYYVIKMKVWVDENGAVTSLQTLSRPIKAIAKIEEDIKSSSFKPAIVNGKPVKMVGLYVRFIEAPIYFSIQ